jgi:hypothetical protein
VKLERLWQEIEKLVPNRFQFGSDPDYEGKCRAFRDILSALPMIDGWKPECCFLSLNDIAQSRFDAQELGELEITIDVENSIEAPGRDLQAY